MILGKGAFIQSAASAIGGLIVSWTNLVYATADANLTLTATGPAGAWNGQAFSTGSIAADGYVEFTATQTGTTRILGLSTTDQGPPENIAEGIYAHSNGTLYKEIGFTPTSIGTWVSGDVLRVERIGTTYYFKKNGVSQSSNSGPSGTLYANAAFFGPGKIEFPTMGNL